MLSGKESSQFRVRMRIMVKRTYARNWEPMCSMILRTGRRRRGELEEEEVVVAVGKRARRDEGGRC